MATQAILTADQVADCFIWLGHRHGSFISNLKLQKLLYYAQGWHLALFGGPLFRDDLEAWVHGPVVASVYRRFKGYGFRNIDEPVPSPSLPQKTRTFLEDVAREYLRLDAYALELMTHQEPPWRNARGKLAPRQASRNTVAIKDMLAFFRGLLNRGHGE